MTTVFFDMDGVLADFVSGVMAHHNTAIPIDDVRWGLEEQMGFKDRESEFWAPLGFDFWANLSPYADGFCLLRAAERLVGPERIGLLTSPCDTAGCVDGKRAWVAKHLPGYKKRLFVGSAKELFAGHNKILVDDNDTNCEKFIAAGGYTVKVPRPWNSFIGLCHPGGFFEVPEVFKAMSETTKRAA